MESQLGLITLWTQGDWVTKSVALILLGMSLSSWIVILIKALDILKFKSLGARTETFWHSEDFAAGIKALGPQQDNPFVQLAQAGQEASALNDEVGDDAVEDRAVVEPFLDVL